MTAEQVLALLAHIADLASENRAHQTRIAELEQQLRMVRPDGVE